MSNTGSINNNGSIIACTTSTTGLIPGGTEVTYWYTDTISIEVPSLGAWLANSIWPDSTTNIASLVIINSLASSINYWISFITLFTDSFLEVELLASTLYFTANSIFVEIISIRALNAGITAPDSTSEIIIELGEESGVVELLLTKLHLLCGNGAY